MLTWEQWQKKSRRSLEASRILLDSENPVEAVSRAYYAVYQMTTGILIRRNLDPRSKYGNWSHHETQEMFHTHICQKADLSFKDSTSSKRLKPGFRALLATRYQADYGNDESINLSQAKRLWRDANRMIACLTGLLARGLL